jgi:DNA-binding CsgD family transcriptional regulator
MMGVVISDWKNGRYCDSEFARDFMAPAGVVASLSASQPDSLIALAVHRSRCAPGFSEADTATLAALFPHIRNLYNCFARAADLSFACPTRDMIADRYPALSRREAEIGAFLCHGFSTAEIASCLFISRRTVESHLESLYGKLDVHDKARAKRALQAATWGTTDSL